MRHNVQVRSMAAVLLRRIYTSSFEEFWPQFPPESQAQLKERTIVSIQNEPNAALRKKICECGAEFARNLLGECWLQCSAVSAAFRLFYWSITVCKRCGILQLSWGPETCFVYSWQQKFIPHGLMHFCKFFTTVVESCGIAVSFFIR